MAGLTVGELEVGDRYALAPGLVVELVEIVRETPRTRTLREVWVEATIAPRWVGEARVNTRRRGTIFESA